MIQKTVHELVENKNPGFETTKEAMGEIMSGNTIQAQISSFLAALRMKGKTIDKITTCAIAVCDKAIKLSPPFPMMNIVEIEGDEAGIFNISTTNASAAVAGGIRVVKHGSCSVSSEGGAVDVPERLGAELALTAEQAEAVLEDTEIHFLFTPAYYSSMKCTVPARKEIGIKSIFNILGPLSNPVGASMQLLGVYNRNLAESLTQILINLGVTRGMVVYEGDRLDEATLTGPTRVCEIRHGKITAYDMTPEESGLTVCNLEELIGGTPEENAQITRNILFGGLEEPKRDVVILNTTISLYLGIDDCTMRDCVKTAWDMIDSGAAMIKIEEFVRATRKAAEEVKAL